MEQEEINTWEQKKRFHAMVRDISRQVVWAGEMMDEHEWKLLILAGAYGQDVVPNPLGDGFVVRNKKRVRSLPKMNMTDLITQLFAFGAEKGVEWTDPESVAMREQEAA
jgi:hypothetical protein